MNNDIHKPTLARTSNAVLGILFAALGLAACNKAPTPTIATPPASIPNTPAPSASMSDVTATLGGSSEVPIVSGAGTGTFEAKLDPSTKVLKWTVAYNGLTGVATSAHFHGPATIGENAPPVVPVDGILTSPINGETTLTAAQLDDLKSGKWYFNVHTAANPNGEIRGQLAIKP
jgi:CHRD domain